MNFNKFINSDYLKENPLCGINTYKDTLNLATGVCTRQIEKLVLTGEENIDKNTQSASDYIYYFSRSYLVGRGDVLNVKCTHLTQIPTPGAYAVGINTTTNQNVVYINMGSTIMNAQPSGNTVAGLKEYLSAQYTNGTPVTIWYVLATPETETIAVPSGLSGTEEGYLIQDGTPTPINPIYPSANTVEKWFDLNHYIHNTSTDTITTLPAVLYPNDTTATVGLKGNTVQSGTPNPDNPIMPQGTGERTTNLFDKNNQAMYFNRTSLGSGSKWRALSAEETGIVLRIPCLPSTTYTISLRGEYTQSVWNIELTSSDNTPTVNNPVATNTITNTKPVNLITVFTTLANTKYILVQLSSVYINSGGVNNIMLNLGSTPLPYEPYGYKIPISSGGKNLCYLYKTGYRLDNAGNEIEAANYNIYATPASANTAYTINLDHGSAGTTTLRIIAYNNSSFSYKIVEVNLNSVPYTFTTPTNCDEVKFSLSNQSTSIMLNAGSTALPYEPYNRTTTPVYLGEVQSVRNIYKFILDGTEDWKVLSSDNSKYYLDYLTNDYLRADSQITYMCSHYISYEQTVSATLVPNLKMSMSSAEAQRLYIADANFTTTDQFKAYLTAQYANSTPVTVWYVLATEEIAVVNEPLMKIGNYVDTVSDITIPTIAGEDTLSVGTTIPPSEVTVNYKGWHPLQSVHEYDSNYTIATMQTLTIAQLQTHTISELQGGEWL